MFLCTENFLKSRVSLPTKFSSRTVLLYPKTVPGWEVVLCEGPETIGVGFAVLNVAYWSNTSQHFTHLAFKKKLCKKYKINTFNCHTLDTSDC